MEYLGKKVFIKTKRVAHAEYICAKAYLQKSQCLYHLCQAVPREISVVAQLLFNNTNTFSSFLALCHLCHHIFLMTEKKICPRILLYTGTLLLHIFDKIKAGHSCAIFYYFFNSRSLYFKLSVWCPLLTYQI